MSLIWALKLLDPIGPTRSFRNWTKATEIGDRYRLSAERSQGPSLDNCNCAIEADIASLASQSGFTGVCASEGSTSLNDEV